MTRRGGRPALAATLGVVLLPLGGLVAGCSGDDDPPPAGDEQGKAAAVRLAGRVLDQRAEALLDDDRPAFERGLDGSDPELLSRQQIYFDNLQKLPVQTLDYEVDAGSAVRDGKAWLIVVNVSLELRGFDTAPVTRPDRFRFVPRHDGRRYVVGSVDDPEWEARMDVRPEPWDVGPIEVEERTGVLGIFDQDSIGAAASLMTSLDEGRDQVDAVVPGPDPPGVVVYALSTREVISQIDDRVDPGRLDGVTFAVRSRPGASGTVGYRVALDPRVLDEPGPARDRLVRHELTHVALGDRARGAPLWVSEGIAEFVSVQAFESPRDVPASAVDLARAGVTAMPDDAAFVGPDAEGWYAVAWYAMEVLVADAEGDGGASSAAGGADEEDAAVLFQVLDDVRGSPSEQDAALLRIAGLDTATLASRAADLLLQRYG